MKPTLCLNVLLTVVLTTHIPAQEPSGRLATDQYLDMETVADPQISPDGKRIIYTRRSIDRVRDRWQSALWIMNGDGGDNHLFAEGTSPKWSPDGRRIAYLGEGKPKGTQVFVRTLQTAKESTQITSVDQSPTDISWSPSGDSIAFTMSVPSMNQSKDWQIALPARPKGASWAKDPRIIDRKVFRLDRDGFLSNGNQHVFVIPSAGGKPRRVSGEAPGQGDGSGFGGDLSWTPDGTKILFSSWRMEDWEYPWRASDVFAVNLQDQTISQLTERHGPDHHPLVSPDGRWVAYAGYDWSNDTYIASQIFVMGADGSNPRAVTTSLDRSPYPSPYGDPPRRLWWAPNSGGVYFNADDRGTRNLYFASIQGEVRQVTHGNHILTVTDINSSGQAVGTATSYHKGSDVVTFNVERPELKQLTFVNDDVLRNLKLGDVEEVWYNSADNLRIQGWIVKPPDFDPKTQYPLILSIHGGPHGMYGVGFDFSWQHHAARGYVVLYLNPRGSTGYGEAFANAINNAYPGKDFDDLMQGVDEIISRGYIDKRNLFVYGCSGGGLLTAWIVGHTDRFAAASANCAVTNWLSLVGTTDGISFSWNFKQMPWDDPSEHLKRSPIVYAGNVKTPTLLMTGELDLNTPIAQAEEFFRSLKLRNVPTALIRFNDEWHGTTSRPSNFIRTQLYLHLWFDRYKST
jgi:dipeptidyl aminopeptidase/acylaminoacyl peptidase